MKFLFTTLLCLSFFIVIKAQTTFTVRHSFQWSEKNIVHDLGGRNIRREMANFKEAVYGIAETPTLPTYAYRFPVSGDGRVVVEMTDLQFAPLSISSDKDQLTLTEDIKITSNVTQAREKYFGNVKFVPIRKTAAGLEKLISFELKITFISESKLLLRGPTGTRESALKDGDIYKFSVKETGIFKIDYDFLKNQLKIANIDQIDPRTIKLLGNGSGMLPEANAISRADDLVENTILISGEEDGKFDGSDFILFYATGPDKWNYNPSNKQFNRPKNIYSDESFYFIKVSGGNGARLPNQNSVPNNLYTSTAFNDFQRFEVDRLNILASQSCNCTQGSGKLWVGDFFGNGITEKNYTDKFNLTNILTNESASIQTNFVGRSTTGSSFGVSVAGNNFSNSIETASDDVTEYAVARESLINSDFTPKSDNLDIKIKYPFDGNGEGWLDFIQVNVRRKLQLYGAQTAFRDVKTTDYASTNFQLSNANSSTLVWDVTTPQKFKNQQVTLNGNLLSFGANTEGVLREFIAFDKNAAFAKPNPIGKISNQNLHGIDNIDLLIIYPKDFENTAKTLAEQRRSKSGLSVEMVEINQVYNEFSSGALDVTAIRDFARMLLQRNSRFKYLLLLGDGSFDYKRTYPLGSLPPSDFIPPYETDYSLSGVSAFPSDDYYGLLSNTEGVNLLGDLDIGVGRIPCKTADEANGVINKILHYESNDVLGDWRNRILFMADNGDGNVHINASDGIAENVVSGYKNFNVNKLFVDAFPLEVSAGGTRVPALNQALFQDQFQGLLAMCYLGHGGPKRLAQEAIITREDMETWKNFDKLPIFVTATCSFSGYDNPKETVSGEAAILNPRGSMVALFSTVRAVYTGGNEELTRSVFNNIFKKQNFKGQALGDIIVEAKNQSSTNENGNKFTLIGDPSMRIALPRYEISTTKINGKVPILKPDTARALQKVTIEGAILDDKGQILKTFNGTIYPTVFDKIATQRTLGQGSESPVREYSIQRNVIFKGAATVKNGEWKFTFVVPRDIDYAFGKGKISYYATDGSSDAAGNFDNIIIGGTDPSVKADNLPPLVQVFMNDDKFVLGGITDPNPTLFVKLSDDNGINVAGTSIGHDLTGNLNESKTALKLNNFYEAVKDDPTKGTVKYPLSKLAVGRYRINVKAWDVANNPGEGFTEFVVASDAKAALEHVLNYPNPFTTNTKFQFEHNMAGQDLKVRVNVFTVSGKLVKTIDEFVNPEGFRVADIKWDGKDEYGDELARGVYLYQVKVTGKDAKGQNTSAESSFEKLVILK